MSCFLFQNEYYILRIILQVLKIFSTNFIQFQFKAFFVNESNADQIRAKTRQNRHNLESKNNYSFLFYCSTRFCFQIWFKTVLVFNNQVRADS